MRITNIGITPAPEKGSSLLAFVEVEFDECFIVRDVKVIENRGRRWLQMPNRKITYRCPSCGRSNAFDAKFCAACGSHCDLRVMAERPRNYYDVAFPHCEEFRLYMTETVLKRYGELQE